MIASVFLLCALAAPAVGATHYTPSHEFGAEEISVIRMLKDLSEPFSYGRDRRAVVLFGNQFTWVQAMRNVGVSAHGITSFAIRWHTSYMVGLRHLLPLRSESINVFLFVEKMANFDEVERVLKPKAFLVFDPAVNPHLVFDVQRAQWRRRFNFHHYQVWQKRVFVASQASWAIEALRGETSPQTVLDVLVGLRWPYIVHFKGVFHGVQERVVLRAA